MTKINPLGEPVMEGQGRKMTIPKALAKHGLRVLCALCGRNHRWFPKLGGKRLKDHPCPHCGLCGLMAKTWAEKNPNDSYRRTRALRLIYAIPVDCPDWTRELTP